MRNIMVQLVSRLGAELQSRKYFLEGFVFWSIVVFIIYAVRPNARLSTETVETTNHRYGFMIALVAELTILLCILPMSLSPSYNGGDPQWRTQYEVLAESILDGRVNLDYGDMDPRLLELDNPYDFAARDGIPYHWDHSFYKGQYYMYFGIVPVLLLFLPFRIVTGTSLTTYHATQVFTALFILGVFALFLLLAWKFFRKMSLSVYLSLSAAVSIMSVWYISAAPALYCTAIAAGICMEIWSLFFFVKAVWDSDGERQSTCMGVLGSLFGALAFGCRPTIALANILAIPMFVSYLKKKNFNLKLWKQILAVLTPYVVIGFLLMAYNYARFENPFEFGQSYQLTVADQRNVSAQLNLIQAINGVLNSLFAYAPLGNSFPYLSFQSVLFNFPIWLVAILCLFPNSTLSTIRKNKLSGLMCVLFLLPALIIILQVTSSTHYTERYRSDIYWLVGIFLFLSFGHFLEALSARKKKICGFAVSLLAFVTIFRCFLLWTVPWDYNFTNHFPEYLDEFQKVLRLGF